MLSRLSPWVLLAIVLLLTAVAFALCLQNGFINLDDGSYIVDNPSIRSFSGTNIVSWLTRFHKGNYYPLVLLTYALEYQLQGADPFVFHASSLALHLVNCGLAFWLLLRLTGRKELSFVATAIWAVHPLRVESVAWAAEQKDLLYTLFVLLSLGWYSRYKQQQDIRKYLLSLGAFLLACCAKGLAVATVPLLFVVDDVLGKKIDRRSWAEKIPYIATAILFGVLAFEAQEQSLYIETDRSLLDRLLGAGYGFFFYLLKFIWPFNLSAFHPFPRPPLPWWLWLSSLASLALLVLIPLGWRRHNLPFQGALFYAASIVFVLQLVPVGGFVAAERYSYLSSVGLALAAAWCLLQLVQRPALRATGLGLITLLLATSVALSAARCVAWQGSISIWSDAIEQYPNSNAFAYNQRGSAYDEAGRLQDALADFSRAVAINPLYCDAYYNRSCAYYELSQFDEAVADSDRAIAHCPKLAAAFNNRGLAYGGKQNMAQALADISHAIELSPLDASFFYNRATIYGQMQAYPQALADFDRAIERAPDYAQAYFYRGYTLSQMGEPARAQADMDTARRLGWHE